MPVCPEGHLEKVEAKVAQVSSITQLHTDMQEPEVVVRWLLEGLEPQLFEPIPVSYKYKCSKEKGLWPWSAWARLSWQNWRPVPTATKRYAIFAMKSIPLIGKI